VSAEFSGIKTYATLSPIPGFRAWLNRALDGDERPLITHAEHRALSALGREGETPNDTLKKAMRDPRWHEDDGLVDVLKNPLMRLCAHYLLEEKRRGTTALDPVAHFHLSNGARMEVLNWMGDRSENGYAQSAGMMMNYLYKMDRIESNHEGYTSDGTIAASSSLRSLLKN